MLCSRYSGCCCKDSVNCLANDIVGGLTNALFSHYATFLCYWRVQIYQKKIQIHYFGAHLCYFISFYIKVFHKSRLIVAIHTTFSYLCAQRISIQQMTAMEILNFIILTLIFCLTPAGVLWLCRRFPALDKLGPIMILYALGMLLGNLPCLPEQITVLQDILPNVMIPLAIPMMLFGCNFSFSEARLQTKVVISGFLSVCCAVVVGYLLFGCHMEYGAEVGGIISGMYTGGTLNAAALQAVLQIPSETFVLVNSYDIIISFLYFVFLFGFGIRLFRRAYGQGESRLSQGDREEIERRIAQGKENPYRGLCSRKGLKELARIVLVALLIIVLSAGTTLLFPSEWFMVVFILMLTTLGVAASFVQGVRKLQRSYDIGMYLIYIFSMVIASMADFSNLDLAGGINQIAFMSVVVFLSLLIHAVLCRLMKVDADSMVISSVAFINSPPFVPMVSAAMQNKRTLVTGLSVGIVGYALGNHFGVIMSKLLSCL